MPCYLWCHDDTCTMLEVSHYTQMAHHMIQVSPLSYLSWLPSGNHDAHIAEKKIILYLRMP